MSEKVCIFPVAVTNNRLQCRYMSVHTVHWPSTDGEYHLDICTDLPQRSLKVIKTNFYWEPVRDRERRGPHTQPPPSASHSSRLQLLTVTATVWIMQRSPALARSSTYSRPVYVPPAWKREGRGSYERSKPKLESKRRQRRGRNCSVLCAGHRNELNQWASNNPLMLPHVICVLSRHYHPLFLCWIVFMTKILLFLPRDVCFHPLMMFWAVLS